MVQCSNCDGSGAVSSQLNAHDGYKRALPGGMHFCPVCGGSGKKWVPGQEPDAPERGDGVHPGETGSSALSALSLAA